MDAKIDFKALINSALISGLEKSPDGKMAAGIMRVFEKHGVGVMDAMAILMEMAEVIQQEKKD